MEYIQGTLFGRMCPEPLAVTKEKTSGPCLTKLLKSASRTPLCLTFRKQAGLTQTVTAATDGALRTEFLTLNTGECPNDAVESTLSQILEVDAPEKYYLSKNACLGILRRAKRRGKALPKMLLTALTQQIRREGDLWQSGESEESLHETLSAVTKREISPIETAPWQTVAGNAEIGIGADDRTGKTACVLMDAYQHHGWREGETCGTLTAENNNHVRGDTRKEIEAALERAKAGLVLLNVSVQAPPGVRK